MINVTPADTAILIGALQATLGLVQPQRLLQRLGLDATTLVVTGAFIGTIGLFLKAVLE